VGTLELCIDLAFCALRASVAGASWTPWWWATVVQSAFWWGKVGQTGCYDSPGGGGRCGGGMMNWLAGVFVVGDGRWASRGAIRVLAAVPLSISKARRMVSSAAVSACRYASGGVGGAVGTSKQVVTIVPTSAESQLPGS